MGWVDWYAGLHEQAIHEWTMMAELEHDERRIALEKQGLLAFQHGGTVAYAKLHLKASREKSDWEHASHDVVSSEWYSCAGEHDAAIHALQEMVAHHDNDSLTIAVDPLYDSLHADPRFGQLLVRIYGRENAARVQKRLKDNLKNRQPEGIACPLKATHSAHSADSLDHSGERT
jgi:hypothetical protein